MLLFLFFACVLAGGGNLPPNWWLKTHGVSSGSNNEFKDLIASEDADFKDKHVFIDFYMQGCYWCQVFQSDWNKIVDELKHDYGDIVEFVKVDG
jgi:thiol:disulfide interchange protein